MGGFVLFFVVFCLCFFLCVDSHWTGPCLAFQSIDNVAEMRGMVGNGGGGGGGGGCRRGIHLSGNS